MILAAAAALVLCACAKVDTVKITPDEAVSFGVYAGKAVSTKAVSATDYYTIDTDSLKASTFGFGVFGYYTDAADYDQTANPIKANFMYNQQVTWASTKWTYSPVKYWPNEHGASAVSTDTDKLTFLAYAPFVENLAINGATESTVKDGTGVAATEGIIAMTGNQMTEDAKLTFKVPASAKEQIDLLYGVMAAQYTDVEGNTIGTVGNPLENLTKQTTSGKVEILFKHALSRVAIDIKDVIDQVTPESSIHPTTTKVVVKSIKLVGTTIGTQGVLNLYTGAWNVSTSATEFNVAPLPDTISVNAAPTAFPSITGVDEDGLEKTIDIMLIPSTSPATTITGVEIVYYVCTQDANLDGGVSVVENKISKDFTSALTLVKGKQYNLNILLGLTSIELDATVDNWSTESTTNVDLPKNK